RAALARGADDVAAGLRRLRGRERRVCLRADVARPARAPGGPAHGHRGEAGRAAERPCDGTRSVAGRARRRAATSRSLRAPLAHGDRLQDLELDRVAVAAETSLGADRGSSAGYGGGAGHALRGSARRQSVGAGSARSFRGSALAVPQLRQPRRALFGGAAPLSCLLFRAFGGELRLTRDVLESLGADRETPRGLLRSLRFALAPEPFPLFRQQPLLVLLVIAECGLASLAFAGRRRSTREQS